VCGGISGDASIEAALRDVMQDVERYERHYSIKEQSLPLR
jgi:hypothetical protein